MGDNEVFQFDSFMQFVGIRYRKIERKGSILSDRTLHVVVPLQRGFSSSRAKKISVHGKAMGAREQARDRRYVLHDVLDKIAMWTQKSVECGDIAMQRDPGHAALPCAAIRFMLKGSI